MALDPDFPESPYALLDPLIRSIMVLKKEGWDVRNAVPTGVAPLPLRCEDASQPFVFAQDASQPRL